MGGLGVKVQHFPFTLLVVLTTLTLPCERDAILWHLTRCNSTLIGLVVCSRKEIRARRRVKVYGRETRRKEREGNGG